MVFVSVVSPTTTVCGSFVGAVGGGGGGGGASSVVLQSIVGHVVCPVRGFRVRLCQDTFDRRQPTKVLQVRYLYGRRNQIV